MKITLQKKWGKHKPGTELDVTVELAAKLKYAGYLDKEQPAKNKRSAKNEEE